ncbi:MAG: gfo/Idh/MocA family oxidoreductase [Nitrosopumilales archaeon]|nr:MAG: gfo/Idh/MocA family oxidoreductase [Nitrosopumilales archaeon]
MKNIAIVGLGKWGKNLLREFSGVCNIAMCHSIGNRKNLEWLRKNFPNIKHTKNFQDILNDELIDAVVIASPIKTHFPLSSQVIHTQKHLFIEKTISENSSDARKLISMAKKKNLVLFVGHIFIHHPVLDRIKAITKNESITYLKLSWMKIGSFQENILLDLVSHFISIIIELLGIPRDVKVIDFKKVVSSYDIVTIEFRFNKGRRCIVDVNRVSNFKKRSITIVTTKNTFQWEDDILYKFNKKKHSYDLIFRPDRTSLEIECKKFIQSLNKRTDYSNADKSLKIIQLVEKCRKMMEK